MNLNEEKYRKALERIFKILDNIEYERENRTYTISDEEMSYIFHCKNLAELALNEKLCTIFGLENDN